MKKFIRTMQGVTLLEIMLVLAIAAMVIVMSVRYYQSANASQQATNILSQIQSITAAADSLAQAGGGGYNATNLGQITSLLPTNSLISPWGSTITVTAKTGTTYDVAIPGMPPAVCLIVHAQLSNNAHFTNPSACSTTAQPFTYTYDSTA